MTSPEEQQVRNNVVAQSVVGALLVEGVRQVVVCPGSRSTPIVAALQHHRAAGLSFSIDVILDERGAGFFAVGAARVSRSPVAIVTTSGTAVANLLPALTEAHQEGLPIIALTANRPLAALGTDDNQVVPQRGMFSTVTSWSGAFDGACETASVCELEAAAVDVVREMAAAWGSTPGPVHLDVAFEKPLEPTPTVALPLPPRIEHDAELSDETQRQLDLLQAAVSASSRPVLAVGRSFGDVTPLLSSWPGPVITDVFVGRQQGENVASCPNALVASGALDDANLVVQLGGSFVSKDFQLWKRRADAEWWRVDRHCRVGSVLREEHVVRAEPSTLACPGIPRLDERWVARVRQAADAVEAAAPEPEVEMAWVSLVIESLPSQTTLLLGNSSPVRDADDVCRREMLPVHVIGNRGASGIDGLVATAIGAAAAGDPVLALVGDLSALHDVSSLFLLQQTQAAVCVLVINNAEGSIFRRLPVAAHDALLRPYFLTPHQTSLTQVARGFGIAAETVGEMTALPSILERWREDGTPLLLEVLTDGEGAQQARARWREQQEMS